MWGGEGRGGMSMEGKGSVLQTMKEGGEDVKTESQFDI